MDAQMKVSRGSTRLVVKFPFYGSVCLRVNVKPDASVSTMATDGKSILWSPDPRSQAGSWHFIRRR